jgi:hypothetical protein
MFATTMKDRLPPAWFLWVAIAVCALHLAFAAVTIHRSNQNLDASDQGAEIWLADVARQDAFPSRTDGVRHPLFSWLVRSLHVPDKEAFFVRGKWFNTSLSVVFLILLGGATARRLGPVATANLMLLASLGILVVRGTYFQPEPLYYALFTACAVCAWAILRGTRPLAIPLFAFLCGFAFLAKPSLSPFLAAFFLGLVVKGIAGIIIEKRLPLPRVSTLAATIAGLVIFAAIITPLGIFSAKHFGTPFFNYPQYWMWMDDFGTEAWPWQDRYPGRVQLESLTPEETPSPAWYFQRHAPADALTRLASGTREVTIRFFSPEPKKPWHAALWKNTAQQVKWEQVLAHRGIFAALLGALSIGLAVIQLPALRTAISSRPGIWGAAAFTAATFLAYTLLYGWYWPIGRGDRFMGSLWTPLILLLSILAANLHASLPATQNVAKKAYPTVHLLILVLLVLQSLSTALYFAAGGALTTRN